jgi:hypothetical protein
MDQRHTLALAAIQSGKGIRWLEDYASNLLLAKTQAPEFPAVIGLERRPKPAGCPKPLIGRSFGISHIDDPEEGEVDTPAGEKENEIN